MKYERIHQEPLFDLGDEWLARIVCYAYSLPPNAFVKQMNRATATTAQEVALEEGLAPLMEWDKRFMDRLILLGFGRDDYEFLWEDAQDVDPMVQAEIDDKYVRMGVRAPKDIADDHGWDAPPEPVAPPQQPGEPSYQAGGGAPPKPGAAKPDTQKLAAAVADELELRKAERRKAIRASY
jgi:hypothetical protein